MQYNNKCLIQATQWSHFLKDVFNKTKNSNKMLHIAGDFNMNLLDYEKCKKVQEYVNPIYENSMIPKLISLPESSSKALPQLTIS